MIRCSSTAVSSGSTRSASRRRGIRTLEEVKDQVEKRWRAEEVSKRLRAKAAEMIGELEKAPSSRTRLPLLGVKVETASAFKRDAEVKGVPERLIAAAFRTPKDGVGQTEGANSTDWIVFKVTDVTVPPVDMASDDVKKLKDTLERALSDEQVAQYAQPSRSDVGTTINQNAFAVATGGSLIHAIVSSGGYA